MSFKESDDSLAELLTLTCEVDEWGAIRYRNSEGELHRVCGPAVIYPDGSEWWYQRGQIHREDGPAAMRCAGIWWVYRSPRTSAATTGNV